MVIGYSTCRNPIKFPLIGKYDFINGIHKKFFWVIRKRHLPLKFNKKEYLKKKINEKRWFGLFENLYSSSFYPCVEDEA